MQNENALLLADDDACMRSLVRASAEPVLDGVVVFEAGDGAEAIQVGLQERPQVALLDINMPRVGGIEVALVLRELLPQLQVALYSAEADARRECARSLGLPLFDKSDLDRATHWLAVHVPRSVSRVCGTCGYGICRAVPPRRCPMCQGEAAWRSRDYAAAGAQARK